MRSAAPNLAVPGNVVKIVKFGDGDGSAKCGDGASLAEAPLLAAYRTGEEICGDWRFLTAASRLARIWATLALIGSCL